MKDRDFQSKTQKEHTEELKLTKRVHRRAQVDDRSSPKKKIVTTREHHMVQNKRRCTKIISMQTNIN